MKLNKLLSPTSKFMILCACSLLVVGGSTVASCNSSDSGKAPVAASLDDSIEGMAVYDATITTNTSNTPVPEPEELVAEVDLADNRYASKLQAVENSSARLLYADGRKIFYSQWAANETGYDNKMVAYDSETDSQQTISLNKTSMIDEEMNVDGIVENNGVLTVIMTEMRNSNGWVEGTYVWQYNCKTGAWKPIAKECSGAEFINNGKAVKIDRAICLNPDEPTFMQEYRHRYTTVNL